MAAAARSNVIEKLLPLLSPDVADGLRSQSTEKRLPFVDGDILRCVADDDFADSFGFQWNRFEVRQKLEDEETFTVKTGVPLADLKGMSILDAGCGGGRYLRVAGEAGAKIVVGVDRSRAVDKARQLCDGLNNAAFVQADLTDLPFMPSGFDLVFSIGVLHHGPDPRASFDSIAKLVRPGGRLSVWLYRRATAPQEWVNDFLRRRTTRMSREKLLRWSQIGGWLGGIPVLSQVANKIVSFSAHPSSEIRVCDTFDWYSPQYQTHHTVGELAEWFQAAGFADVRELPPAKKGRLYLWAQNRGLLIGSGVNMTGVRR